MATTSLGQSLKHFWFGPVDPIRLKAFRVCLGISLLLYMAFRWWHAGEWLTADGFHISPANLPYFEWTVPLLPQEMLPVFGILFFGSMVAFIAGWQVKWTGWLVLAGLVYVSAADQLAFFSPNKILIGAIFILAASTLGGYARRQDERAAAASAWPLRILQLTAMIHLFMAGWAKIGVGGEWLAKPYVVWTQMQGTYRTDFAAFLLNTLPQRGWILLQWSALLFELCFPFLLAIKRLRWIAIVWGIGFQLMIALTMKHLIYFNLIMVSFFVLFLDEEQLRAWWIALRPAGRKRLADVPSGLFKVTAYDE